MREMGCVCVNVLSSVCTVECNGDKLIARSGVKTRRLFLCVSVIIENSALHTLSSLSVDLANGFAPRTKCLLSVPTGCVFDDSNKMRR